MGIGKTPPPPPPLWEKFPKNPVFFLDVAPFQHRAKLIKLAARHKAEMKEVDAYDAAEVKEQNDHYEANVIKLAE